MAMRRRGDRILLITHIACSVGWLGAVVASLVLATVGVASSDPSLARAAYMLLEPLGWGALVPLSAASLCTGLLRSATTRWSLTRHAWVKAKLVLNAAAVIALLLYMRKLAHFAAQAHAATATSVARTPSPALHAIAALALLLLALALSVYKPRELYLRGRAGGSPERRQHEVAR